MSNETEQAASESSPAPTTPAADTASTATTTTEIEAPAAAAGTEEGKSKTLISDDKASDGEAGAPAPAEPLTVEALGLAKDFAPIYEGAVNDFVEVFNGKHETSADLAKALLQLHDQAQTRATEAATAEFEALNAKWIKEVEADPAIGGAKQAEVLGSIKEFINEVMGKQAEEVFEAMHTTNAGNNPAIIRLLAKAAEGHREAVPVEGSTPASGQGLSRAQRMFPNMN